MLDVRDFTYGLALGAGAMFLFDPQRGPARRARARTTARRMVHDLRHSLQVGSRDLDNRSRGLGARARDADGVPGLEGEGGEPSSRGGRPPGTNFLIGASAALLLLTPLAPMLVRTALFAAVASLLREAAPQVRQAVHRIGKPHMNGRAGDRDANQEWQGQGQPT